MNGEAPKFSVENLARAAAAWFPADCKILIFNSVYGVIYSHGCLQVPQQLTSLKQLFNSREAALQQGLTLDGQRFEVHRHHPPFICGREMGHDVDPDESAGFVLYMVENGGLGSPCYALVTFRMPETTARMASSLQRFCQKYLSHT